VRYLRIVVDAVDERPLKGNSALLRFDVFAARVNELRDGVAAVDGHDGAPSGVAGFVKRHRERELLGLMGQLADARRQTHGGDGDVPGANAELTADASTRRQNYSQHDTEGSATDHS